MKSVFLLLLCLPALSAFLVLLHSVGNGSRERISALLVSLLLSFWLECQSCPVRFNVTSVAVMRTLVFQGLLVDLKSRSVVIKVVSTLRRLKIPYWYMCDFNLVRWCLLCMKLVLAMVPGVWVKVSELHTVLDCFAKWRGKKNQYLFSQMATGGETDAEKCWVFVVVVVSLGFFLFFFSQWHLWSVCIVGSQVGSWKIMWEVWKGVGEGGTNKKFRQKEIGGAS